MVHFSFVLLCYNNWDMTKQAVITLLDSLEHIHLSKGIELIIVDNGSTDETPSGIKQIKEEYENDLIQIKNVRLEQNMGYTPGINAGLAKCHGKIISILNNDLVFPAKWFNGLVEVLEGNEEIGLVVPYLSLSSGIQNVNKRFSSLEEMKAFAANFMEKNKASITFTHQVIGACMVFKQEVIELTGGNDIWFGVGQLDDFDWCIRTLLAGYKIAVVGKSFVHHICSVTYYQKFDLLNASYDTNKQKFQKKWGYKGIAEILETVKYSHNYHFFPTKKEEFKKVPSLPFHSRTGSRKLFVADWTHPFSNWKEKLKNAMINCNGEDEEIYLWIPKQYYLLPEVLDEINKNMGVSLSRLNIIYNTISPSDYLIFFNFFDAIYSVEDDYVNRYLVSIAEMPIL